MDGLELLERARFAGLEVLAVDGILKIKGPKAADSLARLLIANKEQVLAALTPAADQSVRVFTDPDSGDGDETRKPAGLAGVSSPAPDTAQADCGSLHIQPQHWVHRDGKAYCPGCERFMGYIRGEP